VPQGQTRPAGAGSPKAKMHIGVLATGLDSYWQEMSIGTMAGAMGLSMDGEQGYRLFYFLDPKKKAGAPGTGGAGSDCSRKINSFDRITMATAKTIKNLGIDVPYALVRLEVNCGDDQNAGGMFVVTRMKRLDGTMKYPLDVTKAVTEALDGSTKYLEGKKPEIDKLLAELKPQVGFGVGDAETKRSTDVLPFVAWKDDRLVIRVRTRVVDTQLGWGCPVQTEEPCAAVSGKATVELNVTTTVDRKGSVVGTETSPPTTSVQNFPPPM
jgi:hypothetical protein